MKIYILKNWIYITLYVFFVLISSGGFIVGSFFLSKILNAAIARDLNELWKQIIITLILYFFGIFFMHISAIFKSKVILKFNNQLREEISKKIISLNYSDFKKQSSGNYVSWYTNDVNQIQIKLFETFLNIASTVINMILAIISIFLLHWIIALFAISYTIFMIFIPKIFDKLLTKKALEFSNSQEEFTQTVSDKVSGYEEFYNYNYRDKFFDIINKASKKLEKFRYSQQLAETKHDSLIISISILGQFFAIFISAYLAIKDLTSFGSVLSIASLSGTFFIATRESFSFGTRIFTNKKLLKKFIFNTQMKVSREIFVIKEIIIKNITFSYDEKIIFNNFNLNIIQNKKYLLNGPSGKGKSTLLKLIFGHIENYKGEIIFNKIFNYRDIDKKTVQNQIAYISQDSYLFHDTLKNNLTLYSNEYSDDEIIEVLKRVNLFKWFSNLKNNFDEILEEKNNNLSGGEKQRILIARALLQKKKFLFLDESTSNLDKKNAIEIEDMILNFKDITVIIINHNIDNNRLKKFDSIINLK